MSDTSWTPGPWHAFAMMNTKTFAVFGPENDPKRPVVEWVGFDATIGDIPAKTVAANTRLIAAAPELYSELEYFHQWACGEFAMYRHSEHGERVEKLLAKARGEQS